MKTQHLRLLILVVIALAAPLAAQKISSAGPQACNIVGTVTDVNKDVLAGATVVIEGPTTGDLHTTVTNDNGFYEVHDLAPEIPYRVTVSAPGFSNWSSPLLTLKPNQYLILTGSELRIEEARTTVTVGNSVEEIAVEQVRQEELQRVFGILPNYYVVYDAANAVPLSAKLKFRLALKTSLNPVTFVGIGIIAGINQATDSPAYVQGAKGFGQRYGAIAADGFSDILIGGAILPSLLHQDPRYFYQGKGTTLSRALHAMSNPFICKGDNGKSQPNYSSLGGDLGSAALSELYYPESDRGVGLVFGNFLISTAERLGSSLVQEFVLPRFTRRGKDYQK